MHAKSWVWAATLAALAGIGLEAHAQYGPMNPYGQPGLSPPGMMQPGMMPGMMPPGMAHPGMMPPQGMPPPGMMQAGYAGPQAMGPGGMPGCGSAAPGGCGACDDCNSGGWCHKWNVFGEFLYLRARNAEVAYAVPIDGNITDPSDPAFQVGEVQTVDPNYQPGFRFGFGFTLDECSAFQLTYTQLDADANDSLVLPGGLGAPVARSLVSPLPINAAVDTLDAEAHLAVQFKLLDADYKGLLAYNDDYRIGYVVGARYAKLNQEFDALYQVNGFETVATDVEFEGVGLKLGLDAERYGRNRQWFVYGRGDVAFVGGEFRADYFGSNQADDVVVDTSWEAGRLVTITDLEVGLGWENHCGNLRLSTGYMYSMWFNTVRTNDWIDGVRNNNFTDLSDCDGMMTFDGLTARVEFLW
ncbi:MAG: Lpg1974 family pore-forming outer membrane protein [Pirellulaceae bacterium]